MRRLCLTLSAVTVLALAGCGSSARYGKVLDSWVGGHVDQLVSRWGPPLNSFVLSDGGSILEYRERYRLYSRGAVEQFCHTRFIVSPTGIVTGWRWWGNDCVA